MLSLHIELDRDHADGLVRQLFQHLRGLIEEGILTSDMSLPTSRKLAQELGVGRNTVLAAYDQLVLEGYLETDGRRGTKVSKASGGFTHQGTVSPEKLRSIKPSFSAEALRLTDVKRRTRPCCPTFQPGLPELRTFPHDLWGRLLRRAARHLHSEPHLGSYDHYSGLPALKEAILGHVQKTRGVVAEVDQVMIVSSAQAGFDLIARMMLNEGEQALLEEPGYTGVRAVLKARGADIVPMEVQVGGAMRRWDRAVEFTQAKLAYVTPSHQFPLGGVLGLEDRLAVLDLASRLNCFLIEDDYDSEFHFRGAPISSLQGLDRHQCVIYAGTFSKSLMPSLHIAYLILPPQLVECAKSMLRNIGAVPPLVLQKALADFLYFGHFSAYLRDMNVLYQERRDCLAEALRLHCADDLKAEVGDGGIQMPVYLTTACLARGWTDKDLVRRLNDAGVEASALSDYYWSGKMVPRQGLLLGYAASAPDEIARGVGKIAMVLAE